MPQPPDPPTPKPPPVEALERELQRVQKLAGFGAQLASAMRAEFASCWAADGLASQPPEARALVAQVDALRSLASRYLREVAVCRRMPPMQAQLAVRAIDLGALLGAGRGLEALAAPLRQARRRGCPDTAWPALEPGPPAPWATAEGWARLFGESGPPGPQQPAVGWLTGRLQAMQGGAEGPQPRSASRAVPEALSPAARRLKAFEVALKLIGEILQAHGPRLAVLRAGLERESPLLPLPNAGLRALVPGVAAALQREPRHRNTAMAALQREADARKRYLACQQGLQAARSGPPQRLAEALESLEIEALKALVMPLSELHRAFAGVPPLDALFPPPLVQLGGAAGKPTLPLAPAAPPFAKQGALTPAELSGRRLAVIVTYLSDPSSNPALADERLVYRVVAEELAYQRGRKQALGEQLHMLLPGRDAERPALELALAEASERNLDLTELLVYVSRAAQQGGP